MDRKLILQNLPAMMMFCFIAGGLWTYSMPLVRVEVPPVVTERWSAWEMTRPLTKMVTKKESKWDMVKLDFDYMDVLVKILPKKEGETGAERSKLSLTFYLGILVPVALALAYLFLLLNAVLLFLRQRKLLVGGSLFGFASAAYALGGIYYLGRAAQAAFQSSVDARAEGFLGTVTKHLVRKITIQPDRALFVLVVCSFFVFAVHLYRCSMTPLAPGPHVPGKSP